MKNFTPRNYLLYGISDLTLHVCTGVMCITCLHLESIRNERFYHIGHNRWSFASMFVSRYVFSVLKGGCHGLHAQVTLCARNNYF